MQVRKSPCPQNQWKRGDVGQTDKLTVTQRLERDRREAKTTWLINALIDYKFTKSTVPNANDELLKARGARKDEEVDP